MVVLRILQVLLEAVEGVGSVGRERGCCGPEERR